MRDTRHMQGLSTHQTPVGINCSYAGHSQLLLELLILNTSRSPVALPHGSPSLLHHSIMVSPGASPSSGDPAAAPGSRQAAVAVWHPAARSQAPSWCGRTPEWSDSRATGNRLSPCMQWCCPTQKVLPQPHVRPTAAAAVAQV